MASTTPSKIVVLKKDSIGAEVTDLQYILKARSCDPGTIDGKFGPATVEAVKKFQKSKNLLADGIVGSKTWVAMDYRGGWADNQPGNFLRAGDKGDAVLQMQKSLISMGKNLGAPDGVFGAKTKAVVIELQKSGERCSNIEGVVGPLTLGGIGAC
ncbi:MAG: peptidoglycan-binding protein [Nodosilinea sp. WJT8-NPBG4]|jgi:peptidoglycan hydrolase-like protein with peptidoglycan-binding domain|nr:peptidoglycan-binding protein [Nodosilinea sp. WJT8-NPBG4]